MIISELINSAVTQISMSFPDQDREATLDDAVQMMQIFVVLTKAFMEKAVADAQMLESQVRQSDSGAGDGWLDRPRNRGGR